MDYLKLLGFALKITLIYSNWKFKPPIGRKLNLNFPSKNLELRGGRLKIKGPKKLN